MLLILILNINFLIIFADNKPDEPSARKAEADDDGITRRLRVRDRRPEARLRSRRCEHGELR